MSSVYLCFIELFYQQSAQQSHVKDYQRHSVFVDLTFSELVESQVHELGAGDRGQVCEKRGWLVRGLLQEGLGLGSLLKPLLSKL